MFKRFKNEAGGRIELPIAGLQAAKLPLFYPAIYTVIVVGRIPLLRCFSSGYLHGIYLMLAITPERI